jgi:hypothetical protein
VFQGVQQQRLAPLIASFVYKTLIDGIAAWGILAWSVRSNVQHFVWFELALCAFVIASIPLGRVFRHPPPTVEPAMATPCAAN